MVQKDHERDRPHTRNRKPYRSPHLTPFGGIERTYGSLQMNGDQAGGGFRNPSP